jgi:hypothetical protein
MVLVNPLLPRGAQPVAETGPGKPRRRDAVQRRLCLEDIRWDVRKAALLQEKLRLRCQRWCRSEQKII